MQDDQNMNTTTTSTTTTSTNKHYFCYVLLFRSGNSTMVVGPLNFLDSFVKALSVILVSELGDKTFFLAGTKKSKMWDEPL